MDQSKFGALGGVLAKDLSQIEDLPDFIAPPPGVYKMLIDKCQQKTINEKTTIVVEYVFLGLKQLNDGADEQDKAEVEKVKWGKDRMSEAFYFDDPERLETTLGVLKKKYGPLGAVLGKTNLLEILDAMPNMTIEAQVTRRVDDKDKSRFYAATRNIAAAA